MKIKNNSVKFENLNEEIRRRGHAVLDQFRKVAKADIKDPKLLKILDDVIVYWQDNFRPALTSFSCEAVGGQLRATDDISLMITLASAGGGIHDDLVDRSRNKHFRMTILGLHGLDYALLVGDLLILKGWLMAKKLVHKFDNSQKLFETLKIFGDWTTQVCEAEFKEISCRRNLKTKLNVYKSILRMSMVDLQACMRLGAIFGNGLKSEIEALATYGSHLGYMYRLLDDVKDTLNKEFNLRYRLENESIPLPILFAAKSSTKRYSQIHTILKKSFISAIDLSKIIEICFDAKALNYVNNLAKINKENAQELMNFLKPSNEKHVLEARESLELLIYKPYTELNDLCS